MIQLKMLRSSEILLIRNSLVYWIEEYLFQSLVHFFLRHARVVQGHSYILLRVDFDVYELIGEERHADHGNCTMYRLLGTQ